MNCDIVVINLTNQVRHDFGETRVQTHVVIRPGDIQDTDYQFNEV
jgi:hypothetical protein